VNSKHATIRNQLHELYLTPATETMVKGHVAMATPMCPLTIPNPSSTLFVTFFMSSWICSFSHILPLFLYSVTSIVSFFNLIISTSVAKVLITNVHLLTPFPIPPIKVAFADLLPSPSWL
jgi:hypothetical protein